MPHLFSPLTIAGIRLANRLVMSPSPSGHINHDGFITTDLYHYYVERVHGGIGLLLTESIMVTPPAPHTPHLGLYDDAFVPPLQHLVRAVHGGGARIMVLLDAPGAFAQQPLKLLLTLREQFIQAAWRARAAGCDGILLSSADGGVLHHLLSPSLNKRTDQYGISSDGRLRLAQEIIEGIHQWMGSRLLIGFRLIADEFSPSGIRLQDARLIAGRLAGAGVHLFSVTADDHATVPLARFPGWHIPLANGIKRVIPDTPIIGSGMLDEPLLADSVVRDGSVDMVMLEHVLRTNPYWPQIAHIILLSSRHLSG